MQVEYHGVKLTDGRRREHLQLQCARARIVLDFGRMPGKLMLCGTGGDWTRTFRLRKAAFYRLNYGPSFAGVMSGRVIKVLQDNRAACFMSWRPRYDPLHRALSSSWS